MQPIKGEKGERMNEARDVKGRRKEKKGNCWSKETGNREGMREQKKEMKC